MERGRERARGSEDVICHLHFFSLWEVAGEKDIWREHWLRERERGIWGVNGMAMCIASPLSNKTKQRLIECTDIQR